MDEDIPLIDRIINNPHFVDRLVENDYFIKKMQERVDKEAYARLFKNIIRAILFIATLFSPKIADWVSNHVTIKDLWKD